LTTGLPVTFVRKTAKTYGTCRLAEGAGVDERSVLVVEDVVTSGGQIISSVAQLRELGAKIDTAVCVIDRENGGAAALQSIGVKLVSLFTTADLEPPG
jgi:orotate phosphoribosyltransferase